MKLLSQVVFGLPRLLVPGIVRRTVGQYPPAYCREADAHLQREEEILCYSRI